MLRESGAELTVLQACAERGFADLSREQLLTASSDLALAPKSDSTHGVVEALILKAFPDTSADRLARLLDLRGAPPPPSLASELPQEMLE